MRSLEAELKKMLDQQMIHMQESHSKQQIINQLYKEQERLEKVIEKMQKQSVLLEQQRSESV